MASTVTSNRDSDFVRHVNKETANDAAIEDATVHKTLQDTDLHRSANKTSW